MSEIKKFTFAFGLAGTCRVFLPAFGAEVLVISRADVSQLETKTLTTGGVSAQSSSSTRTMVGPVVVVCGVAWADAAMGRPSRAVAASAGASSEVSQFRGDHASWRILIYLPD